MMIPTGTSRVSTCFSAEIIETYGGFRQKLTILALCGGRSGADPCVACPRVEEPES